MQSLNIKPRPAAGKLLFSLWVSSKILIILERIVSAVIAARPRLGDEELLSQNNSINSSESQFVADFDSHFGSIESSDQNSNVLEQHTEN